jgi:hypothetical protein
MEQISAGLKVSTRPKLQNDARGQGGNVPLLPEK